MKLHTRRKRRKDTGSIQTVHARDRLDRHSETGKRKPNSAQIEFSTEAPFIFGRFIRPERDGNSQDCNFRRHRAICRKTRNKSRVSRDLFWVWATLELHVTVRTKSTGFGCWFAIVWSSKNVYSSASHIRVSFQIYDRYNRTNEYIQRYIYTHIYFRVLFYCKSRACRPMIFKGRRSSPLVIL